MTDRLPPEVAAEAATAEVDALIERGERALEAAVGRMPSYIEARKYGIPREATRGAGRAALAQLRRDERIADYEARRELGGIRHKRPLAAGLHAIREQRSLSQEELAKRAGVHITTIQKIEGCLVAPTPRVARTLVRTLKVELHHLFERDPDVPPMRVFGRENVLPR